MILPTEFIQRIHDTHPTDGPIWLKKLPPLLKQCAFDWNIELDKIAQHSYHLIIYATDLNTQEAIILKAGVPGSTVFSEISALTAFQGQGCVRLLRQNLKDGFFLLERITPGLTLHTFFDRPNDQKAVKICSDIILQLHSQPKMNLSNFSFSNLKSRFKALTSIKRSQNKLPFDAKLICIAQNQFEQLMTSTDTTILLHGDLHQSNILQATRAPWLAIDPQGVIGDPSFEPASFMRNSIPKGISLSDLKFLLLQRIHLFSENLHYEKKRIWGWSFVQTLLSAIWIFQDHGHEWEEWYELAQVFLDIKNDL